MKAVRCHGPQDVRLEKVPEPGPPKPDEVVLQILAASLCGPIPANLCIQQ